jgi:hypothetical protein
MHGIWYNAWANACVSRDFPGACSAHVRSILLRSATSRSLIKFRTYRVIWGQWPHLETLTLEGLRIPRDLKHNIPSVVRKDTETSPTIGT